MIFRSNSGKPVICQSPTLLLPKIEGAAITVRHSPPYIKLLILSRKAGKIMSALQMPISRRPAIVGKLCFCINGSKEAMRQNLLCSWRVPGTSSFRITPIVNLSTPAGLRIPLPLTPASAFCLWQKEGAVTGGRQIKQEAIIYSILK